MGQVLRTSLADSDLVEIGIHIARDNPVAADELLSLVEQKCKLLSEFPELGRKRDELAPSLRSFPVGNYVIFYRPVADGIQIIRVLHGARDIGSLL